MKLYEIIIKPVTGFGTPMKGDTLFGHFCWQAAYDDTLLNGGFAHWLELYASRPFAVFSSAIPRIVDGQTTLYALKRPELPFNWFFPKPCQDKAERIDKHKTLKKARWLVLQNSLDLDINTVQLWTDKHLKAKCLELLTEESRRQMLRQENVDFEVKFSQPHNSINRLTQTTGTGMFAPYMKTCSHYLPETELAVFVLADEEATDLDRISLAMKRIGAWGFGRDASTGLGRFELAECDEISLPEVSGANACYLLGPCVPDVGSFHKAWFNPFVRFGRHGDYLAASRNPFKNPVIMADDGAVFQPSDPKGITLPYMGRAVTGTSKVQPGAVCQGYAPLIPFRLEATHERDIPLFD